MKTCMKCGMANKGDNRFCSFCGQKLEEEKPATGWAPAPKDKYEITFQRPNSLLMFAYSFHIKVDKSITYDLKNGSEIKIMMSPGYHQIDISVFGIVRKKSFGIQVEEDKTFVCAGNPAASITPLLATPVKVNDIQGRAY